MYQRGFAILLVLVAVVIITILAAARIYSTGAGEERRSYLETQTDALRQAEELQNILGPHNQQLQEELQ
jgi:Tfp pilus assembly protein PilX